MEHASNIPRAGSEGRRAVRRRRGAGCPSVRRAARTGSTPRSSMRARWEPARVSPAGRTARRAGRPPPSPVPFFDGATLADKRVEEIWRGRGSSGARTYVDALGHPETNLRLGHRVLFVLALTDPPDPPISPCPPAALSPAPRPRRKLPGSAFGSRACAAPLSTIRRRDPSARVYHATDDTSGVRSRVARRSAREGE